MIVAGIGVASGVGALAGVAVGGTLAVCSFGAWLIGNRYQRIANDPPRQDFDQVSESFARLIEEFSVLAEEPLATAHRLAAHQVIPRGRSTRSKNLKRNSTFELAADFLPETKTSARICRSVLSRLANQVCSLIE